MTENLLSDVLTNFVTYYMFWLRLIFHDRITLQVSANSVGTTVDPILRECVIESGWGSGLSGKGGGKTWDIGTTITYTIIDH